jgi:hypothetical protein
MVRDTSFVKMRFSVPEDEQRGAVAEWLWVLPSDDGYFTVDSIPFDIMGVSVGDEVSGFVENGHLNFGAVIQQSGNRTVRLKLHNSSLDEVLKILHLEQVDYEGSQVNGAMYAINIPAFVSYGEVKRRLDLLESDGILEYEEANV